MCLPRLLNRRELLALAAAPAFIRHARAADVPRFTLGVACGHPRPNTLVLWTRRMGVGAAARMRRRAVPKANTAVRSTEVA